LDDPDVYPPYGGWTAGPIFRQTAKRIAGLDDQIEKEIIKNEITSNLWTYTPDVTNLTKKEAIALLQKQRLNYSIRGNGNWIGNQSPEAGTELSPGEKITLTLSSPKTLAKTVDLPEHHSIIPDVTGMSMRKATLLINSRGFEVKIIGSGTVHKQFPDPGSMMKQGEAVLIRGLAESLEAIAGVE
jgi:hypothetical protein